MPVSTISAKGQITVPISFRRKLRIKPHDRLVMELEGNAFRVKPAPDFFQFDGFLGKGLPQKEEKQRMRKAVAAHVLGKVR